MTGPLSKIGDAWDAMAMTVDEQVAALRLKARELAAAIDHQAMRDVEGVREWRDIAAKRGAL